MLFELKCKSWHKGKADFKYLRLLKRICQKHRDSISHIERTVDVLGEDPTKITITNASIDKLITLNRVYIYKIENTDLEIEVSGVLLYYSILKHVYVPDRLAQCMRYASTF